MPPRDETEIRTHSQPKSRSPASSPFLNRFKSATSDGMVGVEELCLAVRRRIPHPPAGRYWRLSDIRNALIRKWSNLEVTPRRNIICLRTVSVSIATFIMSVITIFIFDYVDLFGLSKATARYSGEIIEAAAAPFYESKARNNIVVILIDRDFFLDRRYGWPPQYKIYLSMFNKIAQYRPRAVFADLIFEIPRRYDESLCPAQRRMTDIVMETGTSFLFAASRPGARSLFEVSPCEDEAEEEGGNAQTMAEQTGQKTPSAGFISSSPVSWSGFGGSYPLVVQEKENNDNTRNEKNGTISTDMMSPALRLYKYICENPEKSFENVECPENFQTALQQFSTASVAVRWGLATSDDSGAPCGKFEFTFWESIKWSLNFLYQAVKRGVDDDAQETAHESCYFFPTLSAQQVVSEDLAELIKNKIVIFGVHLLSGEDTVYTPVYGKIPGLHLHAMALDNLFTYGEHYFSEKRSDQKGFSRIIYTSEFITLSVFLFTSFVVTIVNRVGGRAVTLKLIIVVFVVVASAALFFSLCLRMPAFNWLGMMIAFGITDLATHAGRSSA